MGVEVPKCIRCGADAYAPAPPHSWGSSPASNEFTGDQLAALLPAWQCSKCKWCWGVLASPGTARLGYSGETIVLLLRQPSKFELDHDSEGNECITATHFLGSFTISHHLYFGAFPADRCEQTLELMSRSNDQGSGFYIRHENIGVRHAMENILCFQSQMKLFPQAIELARMRGVPTWVVHRYLLEMTIGG